MARKTLSFLIVFVLMATLVAACAPAAVPSAPAAEPSGAAAPEGGKTITWLTLSGFYTDWAEQVAKEWEEKTATTWRLSAPTLPRCTKRLCSNR